MFRANIIRFKHDRYSNARYIEHKSVPANLAVCFPCEGIGRELVREPGGHKVEVLEDLGGHRRAT